LVAAQRFLSSKVADELVIGTVVGVDEHPGARAPSLLLTLDLGTYGTHEVVLPTGAYEAHDLQGAQIACRREVDGATVLGAHSHGTGFVPLRPWGDVEPGTLLS
jgi:tRNA-binding EMAP/Myf-like protein